MASILKSLIDKEIITSVSYPPFFNGEFLQYETVMGSEAYGVSSDDSDKDIYGFCIPPKHIIFPHLDGEILGFGRQKKRFDQYQKHHIEDPSARGGRGCSYDLDIYNIVKYFHLCMENNPNMIDSLFTPDRCVLYITDVGKMVRENRRSFLHKGSWHKFKGYSYAQMGKIRKKNPVGARKEMVEKYGYDVKFAYHVVRLIDEGEQILLEGDLDLQRNREQLKSIRKGEWKLEEIEEYFTRKESELEKLYVESSLRHSPDEKAIKQLLLDCLEEYYGSLDDCVVRDYSNEIEKVLRQVKELVDGVLK